MLTTQLRQILIRLKTTQLRQLNNEFGLASDGHKSQLIERLINPPQHGAGKVDKLEDWETANQLEAFLMNFIDFDDESKKIKFNQPIDKIKEELTKASLRYNYIPTEWSSILLNPRILTHIEKPLEALPIFIESLTDNTHLSLFPDKDLVYLNYYYPEIGAAEIEARKITNDQINRYRTDLRSKAEKEIFIKASSKRCEMKLKKGNVQCLRISTCGTKYCYMHMSPEERVKCKAEFEKRQAEFEKRRAEFEKRRAEFEKRRAEFEKRRADLEKRHEESEASKETKTKKIHGITIED